MKKVLIVEDDLMVAMINMEYLNEIKEVKLVGHTCNGADTLKFLAENRVDLILLDIFLGGENGLDILKEIREKGYTVDVIMITSANGVDEVRRALALGSVDYLVKPFDFDRFKIALSKFFRKDKALEEEKFTQEKIDKLYCSDNNNSFSLPKGLNEKTLENVRKVINQFQEEFTIKEVCEATDISNVTIKKYLDYLEKIREIRGDVTHGNIGRPLHLYRKK